MQLLAMFDDTGSMSSVRHQVRRKMKAFVDELFDIVPNLEMGIIIHNDYCDRDFIQKLDFTSDKGEIQSFIRRSSSCGGGDYKEGYAYVLNEALGLSWKGDEDKVAVMIADALPHEKGDTTRKYGGGKVTEQYDWRQKVTQLKVTGINLYPVQALNHGSQERRFYEAIAERAGTVKLDLAQFHHVTQYITAIVHKEAGSLEEYATSKEEFSSNLSLRHMFSTLMGKGVVEEFVKKVDLLGRFQVTEVDEKVPIRNFVEEMGIRYRPGRGFYEWTKSETIQEGKEVLFVHKKTGETISNVAWCRDQLGVPLGTRGRIRPGNHLHIMNVYDVFIQSTSYNRNLMPKTRFLYEIESA